MSMPTSDRIALRLAPVLAGLALLASCGGGDPDALSPGQERIACAVGGATGLSDACTLERGQDARGAVWLLGHAQAGVRRVRPTTDGRGLVTADGVDAARVAIVDADTIEVTIGADRYRLPATVKGGS